MYNYIHVLWKLKTIEITLTSHLVILSKHKIEATAQTTQEPKHNENTTRKKERTLLKQIHIEIRMNYLHRNKDKHWTISVHQL